MALAWFAWELTRSEFWVGFIAFTQFAPAVIFGPIFGVLADRFDRRRASITINLLCLLNMLVLAALAWVGVIDIYLLAALSLLQGALEGAHTPVRMTLIPNIVAKSQLQSAIASTSIAFNISRFVGPAIAGLVIASYGVAVAFAINGLTYFAFIFAIAVVKLTNSKSRTSDRKSVWNEMLDGIRYVVRHPVIRSLLIVVAVASIFGRGALEMLPAYADKVLQRGASGLAILTSALGIGAISTGLVLAGNTKWLNARVVKIAVATAGLLVIGFGYAESILLAVPIVVGLGIIMSLCGVGSQILIQTMVEDDVRGRVSSFWGMIAFGGTALGSLIVGSVASVAGLQETIIASGALCATVALLTPNVKS